MLKNLKVRERLHEFGEAESQALVLFIFLLLGMMLVPFCYPYWDINAWVYALLSLTVIRMLPVAICLIGTKLPKSWGHVFCLLSAGPHIYNRYLRSEGHQTPIELASP